MRFKGLDLNLLIALDMLLEERSVSRAAKRLHLSQPAMSAALNRLRDYFGDPILTATGNRMIPTPHALHLQLQLRPLLGQAEKLLATSTMFDPSTSERRFRICVSDYLVIVLFAELIPRLEELAPGIRVELVRPTDDVATMLEQGELDLLVTLPALVSSQHPTEPLLVDRHVVVGWDRNPLLVDGLTEEQFLAARHVAVRISNLRPAFVEAHLRRLGKERRVDVTVASFALAPEVLVRTQRLAVMHERLARVFASRLPITYQQLPFDFPVFEEVLQYHQVGVADAGLRWLIAQVRAVFDEASVR